MSNTYCGKSCESCAQKEQKLCPGCRPGPGRSWSGDCEIAVCCRDKGHETCDTCTNKRYCGKRSQRDGMIDRRERKTAEQAAQRAELARKAPFLYKWLSILFWLVIPATVASLLAMEAMANVAPKVYLFGKYLTVVCGLVYGLVLLRLAKENLTYRTAGVLRLVTAAASLLLVSGKNAAANWTLLISLPAAVVGLVGTYQEYMAHAGVLSGVDDFRAERWRMLWKWRLALIIAPFASIVVILIFRLLGVLVLVAALIGNLVIGIVELYYLWQTKQAFRDYSNKFF